MKVVAEEQHIDYQFSGLEDDDENDDYDEYDDDDDDEVGSESQDDSELIFDHGHDYQGQDVSAARTSMEVST